MISEPLFILIKSHLLNRTKEFSSSGQSRKGCTEFIVHNSLWEWGDQDEKKGLKVMIRPQGGGRQKIKQKPCSKRMSKHSGALQGRRGFSAKSGEKASYSD